MGRKTRRNLGRAINKLYKKNTIYICNLSAPQAFELFDSADIDLAKPIFEKFILCFIGIFIIIQISISARPENAEWVDQLKSVKDIKQKLINSNIGMVVAACYGMSLAFPYAMEDLQEGDMYNNLIMIVNELVESHNSNTKRIKPSKQDWLPYARGEMGGVKGQLLSCPSSNIAILNIDGSEVINYSIEQALGKIGFEKNTYDKYEIDAETVREKLRTIFLTDKGGLPFEKLIYEEPKVINSKIQNEILGDCLIRTEIIKAKLEKGVEPFPPLSRATLIKYFTKNELFAYNIAIRTGDTQLTKKLTNIAISKSKDSSPK